MPQLHLPTQHDDDDLAIAGALASALRSSDLYVAWSREGGSGRPVIAAGFREECGSRRRGIVGGLFGALSRRRH